MLKFIEPTVYLQYEMEKLSHAALSGSEKIRKIHCCLSIWIAGYRQLSE